ncbi:MAG: GGDEF domain-containing protein [Gemmatimonadaceae bacterium]|nr:GGDEF domain-containing protein [Gemmatimonadaceae bacterium]
MPLEYVHQLVALLGTATAFAVALIAAALLSLLGRRIRRRRTNLTTWTEGWVALAAGMMARALYLAMVDPRTVVSGALGGEGIRATAMVMQVATLLGFALFAVGTGLYTRGLPRRALVVGAATAAGAYALISGSLGSTVHALIFWQAPVVFVLSALCAAALAALAPGRRSRRSDALAALFGLQALASAGWFVIYGLRLMAPSGNSEALASWIESYGFVDAAVFAALAAGMVALAVEQQQRELDDARAELAVAHDQVRREALYDLLTGCMTRQAFREGVGLAVAHATHGTAVLCDLAGLEQINRVHGRIVGDDILWHAGRVLRAQIRPADRLYRWGGDEFLLILPGARAEDVRPRLARAVTEVPALRRASEGGPMAWTMTLSFAEYDDRDGMRRAIQQVAGAVEPLSKARAVQETLRPVPAYQ